MQIIIIDRVSFQSMASLFLLKLMVSTSDNLRLPFTICRLCLLEDIDKMLALLQRAND